MAANRLQLLGEETDDLPIEAAPPPAPAAAKVAQHDKVAVEAWVLVGLAWEQRNAFLHDPKAIREIFQTVRAGVRACAGHPALLGFAIANEIPAVSLRF